MRAVTYKDRLCQISIFGPSAAEPCDVDEKTRCKRVEMYKQLVANQDLGFLKVRDFGVGSAFTGITVELSVDG